MKRAKENYERAYSDAYGDLIRSLPCAACGLTGRTVAAHSENGGMSRKADRSTLLPLCSTGPQILGAERGSGLREGCHEAAFDRVGVTTFQLMHRINFKAIAAQLWADHPEYHTEES